MKPGWSLGEVLVKLGVRFRVEEGSRFWVQRFKVGGRIQLHGSRFKVKRGSRFKGSEVQGWRNDASFGMVQG